MPTTRCVVARSGKLTVSLSAVRTRTAASMDVRSATGNDQRSPWQPTMDASGNTAGSAGTLGVSFNLNALRSTPLREEPIVRTGNVSSAKSRARLFELPRISATCKPVQYRSEQATRMTRHRLGSVLTPIFAFFIPPRSHNLPHT